MIIIDSWTGGASAYRQFHYRVISTPDGGYVLQVQDSEGVEDWSIAGDQHKVAQGIARVLLEDKKERRLA